MLRNEKWREKDSVISRDRKVYVPRDKKLRVEVIQLHHNKPVGELSQTSFSHISINSSTILIVLMAPESL